MNTKQLEYFLELSQTLNYRRASEKLEVAQPTLSKAMRHLEQDLGFSLFQKDGKSIALTSQAAAFLPYAQEAVNLLEQGQRQALKQRRTLRLGCIAALQHTLLPMFVECYRNLYPDSYVQIHNGVSNTLADLLEQDGLDLILSSPSLRYSDITYFELQEQPLYVCLYPGHLLASRSELHPKDLVSETFVGHTQNGFFFNFYHSIFKDMNSSIKIAAEADEDNTLLSLVRSRMGICIVAMNPTLNTNGIITIPLRQEKVRRMVALGCKRSRLNELNVPLLVAHLKQGNFD